MSTPGSSRCRTAAAYKKGFEAGEPSALAKTTDAPPTGVAWTATGINMSFVVKALRNYADHVDGKPVTGDWFGCDLREAANMLEVWMEPSAWKTTTTDGMSVHFTEDTQTALQWATSGFELIPFYAACVPEVATLHGDTL